jgi:threonine/homoserine/homoserine lactone efflux protein
MLFLVSRTLSHGKRAGFASMLGFGTGAMIHSLFVSLGISALLAASATAFTVIKYIGAGYLFYLGLQAFFSGGLRFEAVGTVEGSEPFSRSFLQAVVTDVTNPKVAIFFIAFLPQFYRANGTPKMVQFMSLGAIIVLIGFVIESAIVIASGRIAGMLRKKPAVSRVLDRLFGTVMIGLGAKLLFTKN